MRHRIRCFLILLVFSLQIFATNHVVSIATNTCSNTQILIIPDGEQAVLYAHPITGYNFAQWSDGNTDNPRLVTVASDVTYTAEFVAIPTPETHHVTVYAGVCATPKVFPVIDGEQMVLYAHPNTGYNFTQWSDGNTDNPRILEVTSDATYKAEFVPISDTHVIHNVTIYAGNCSKPTTQDIIEGETLTIYAHPSSGYIFTQWSDGNTDNPRMVTVTSDATYKAEFEQISDIYVTHTITIYAGDCNKPTTQDIIEGETLTIYAHPSTGYAFTQWSDGNTDNPRMVTVTKDATYRALFEVSATPNPDGVYTFTVNAENCSTSLSQNFSQGTEVKLYAEPIDCNYFVRWSDGNTDNPRTVIVDGDATYTAEFSPNQYIITVLSDDENQGIVSIEKD